jgi:hypothetical protein
MAAVGAGKTSRGPSGSSRPRRRRDPRPLWVLGWGGTNTLAQALSTRAPRARRRRSRRSSRSSASTRSPTMDDAGPGSAASSRPALRRDCRRPRTARSTTSRPGPGSAATASIATRRRGLHDVLRRVGQREHPEQGAAREALSYPAASTKATRLRSWAHRQRAGPAR